MAPTNANQRLKSGSTRSGSGLSGKRFRHFLHSSHIFASLVRDIFELQYLDEVTPHTLTLTQFRMLKVITLQGDHPIGDVAWFLGMSPPAATKNLDKLKRLGLILRSPSKGDRRATLIAPSAKGRRLVQEYEVLTTDRLLPILETLGPRDVDQLIRLLEQLSLSILRQEDRSWESCHWCALYCRESCPVVGIRGGCAYREVRRSA